MITRITNTDQLMTPPSLRAFIRPKSPASVVARGCHRFVFPKKVRCSNISQIGLSRREAANGSARSLVSRNRVARSGPWPA